MRIRISGTEHAFHITLPTALIFSRFGFRLVMKSVKVNGDRLSTLSPEAADRLARELKRIKKKHGTWTLVEVQSAGGEYVTVTL